MFRNSRGFFVLITAFIILIIGPFVHAREFEKRTDIPPVGRTDPSRYFEAPKAHGGAGTIRYMELLGWEAFETNLLFVHRGILMPKSGIGEHIHRTMEEMYIIFDSPARYTVDGCTAELPAGSMVLCPMGSSHGIYNPTDREVQIMNIGVALERGKYDVVDFNDDLVSARVESPAPFLHTRLDKSLLHLSGPAHEGKGKIYFRRLWNSESFRTNLYAISHALLPPDTSIGYHQHNTREEVYYILAGNGRYTANDSTFDVMAGDALPCRLRGSPGIYNNSDEDLELLVFSVSVEKGVVTYEKNWGDDSTDR